jgi:hypothetical protein
MKTPLARLLAVTALVAALCAGARAQDNASHVLDSGRFAAFSNGVPVGIEDFQYEWRNDTVFVTSRVSRLRKASDGSVKKYSKSMELIADHADFGLFGYLSNESFDSVNVSRQILASDTSITVVLESNGHGAADKLVRPPGRLFVVDGAIYTMFDVVGRNLHGRLFGTRPLPLVVLADSNYTEIATVSPDGIDTLSWAGRPVITERMVLSDSTTSLRLWVAPDGRMLRLESTTSDLVVLREAPPAAIPPRRRRPQSR